jgi:dihydroorotate dehydrogenase (NAD+) catalytic subunit
MSDYKLPPIDLAPANPYSLLVQSPVLLAPGCSLREFQTDLVGGIATRTATLHTRRGAPPRAVATPAGMVISELPTIGIRTLLNEEGRRWERSSVPVLVSLQGDATECAEMAAMLENVEGVAALLLTPEADIGQVVSLTRRETPRPLLVFLPSGSDLRAAAASAAASGADVLVVAAPPRTAAVANDPVEGFLLGPAAYPLTLQALLDLRSMLEIPVVAFGGIATEDIARACLQAGAVAVMIDAAIWGDPAAAGRIARSLQEGGVT